MATLKFSLISGNIYSEFTISRDQKFRKKTGFITKPEDWKTKTSKRRNKNGKFNRLPDLSKPINEVSKQLRKTLDDLHDAILNQFNEDYSNGIDINSDWLELTIQKHTNQENNENEFLIYQIQKAIDNAPRKKIPMKGGRYKIGLSKGRIKGIIQFKNIIDRFQNEEFKGNEIKVSNIDASFVSKFEDWLFNKKYSHNYIGKQLANLKSILNDIEDAHINIKTSKIQVISEEKEPEDIIYLSLDELRKIKETNLTANYLINARKWLILGCYVGQRASDLLKLNDEEIKLMNGRKVFQIKQQKTGKNVTIPILPEAEEVISSGFPYPISQTKLREYFKEVCRLAGLDELKKGRIKGTKNGITTKGEYPKWKLIGTHVCRRSFASNFYGDIPTAILRGITGHSSEKMFLKYIGKTEDDLAMQMFNYIEKMPKVQVMEVVRDDQETA